MGRKKVDNFVHDRHISLVVMRLLYLVIYFRFLCIYFFFLSHSYEQAIAQPWVTFVNEYFMESIFRMEAFVHTTEEKVPFSALHFFFGVDDKSMVNGKQQERDRTRKTMRHWGNKKNRCTLNLSASLPCASSLRLHTVKGNYICCWKLYWISSLRIVNVSNNGFKYSSTWSY